MRASHRASAASLIPVNPLATRSSSRAKQQWTCAPRPDLHDTLCAVKFAIDFATAAVPIRCPFISKSLGCGDYFHRIFRKRVRAYRIATLSQNDFMVEHIRDAAVRWRYAPRRIIQMQCSTNVPSASCAVRTPERIAAHRLAPGGVQRTSFHSRQFSGRQSPFEVASLADHHDGDGARWLESRNRKRKVALGNGSARRQSVLD